MKALDELNLSIFLVKLLDVGPEKAPGLKKKFIENYFLHFLLLRLENCQLFEFFDFGHLSGSVWVNE
jgi:hypothetical protein